jgi:hypothetical protein
MICEVHAPMEMRRSYGGVELRSEAMDRRAANILKQIVWSATRRVILGRVEIGSAGSFSSSCLVCNLRVSEKLAAGSIRDEISGSLYALWTIALRLFIFVT